MITPEQAERYARQTILPQIGLEGQKKLSQSRVLIVGLGGLGSPVALYLAAAGVGILGLADPDQVDITNLQRQILHRTPDQGKNKTDSATKALSALNPEPTLRTYRDPLTPDNAEALLQDYDVAVGCLDNFPARYALNRACVNQGKPNVFGSVTGFEGQASVFGAPGPCYQCFFRDPPPDGYQPSPIEKGIVGPVAGIIGVIQAMETIKLLLSTGTTLSGRLLLMDALNMSFRQISLRRDPACPICGSASS